MYKKHFNIFLLEHFIRQYSFREFYYNDGLNIDKKFINILQNDKHIKEFMRILHLIVNFHIDTNFINCKNIPFFNNDSYTIDILKIIPPYYNKTYSELYDLYKDYTQFSNLDSFQSLSIINNSSDISKKSTELFKNKTLSRTISIKPKEPRLDSLSDLTRSYNTLIIKDKDMSPLSQQQSPTISSMKNLQKDNMVFMKDLQKDDSKKVSPLKRMFTKSSKNIFLEEENNFILNKISELPIINPNWFEHSDNILNKQIYILLDYIFLQLYNFFSLQFLGYLKTSILQTSITNDKKYEIYKTELINKYKIDTTIAYAYLFPFKLNENTKKCIQNFDVIDKIKIFNQSEYLSIITFLLFFNTSFLPKIAFSSVNINFFTQINEYLNNCSANFINSSFQICSLLEFKKLQKNKEKEEIETQLKNISKLTSESQRLLNNKLNDINKIDYSCLEFLNSKQKNKNLNYYSIAKPEGFMLSYSLIFSLRESILNLFSQL